MALTLRHIVGSVNKHHTHSTNNRPVLLTTFTTLPKLLYRIAGKFGGELNLAVWRYAYKLKSAKFFPRACTYGDTVPYHQI